MRSFPLILSFILVVLFGTAYAELSFPPFESFDKDGNGRIEATEMGLGLVKLLGNGIIKNIEQSLPYQARDGEIEVADIRNRWNLTEVAWRLTAKNMKSLRGG